MAIQAESRVSLDEKVILVRTVGHMAGCTTVGLQYFMDDFTLVILLSVALGTDRRTFLFEKMFPRGGMGVVAICTQPLLHRCMHLCLVQPYFPFVVTCITESIPAFLQDQRGYSAVPKVTSFAFFFFHDSVDLFHAEVFVRKFFVAIKTVFLRKFELSGRRTS